MEMIKYLGASAILIALGSSPAFAQAVDTTPGETPAETAAEAAAEIEEDEYEETDEELEESIEAGDAESKQNWNLSANVGLNVSQGTFTNLAEDSPNSEIANETAEEQGRPDARGSAFDRVSMGYSLRPSYTYGDHTVASGVSFSQYLTRGGGLTEPNEVRFGDIPIEYSWAGYNIEPIDTRISARGGLAIPTSARSQAAKLYTNTNAGFTFSKRFVESVGLSLSLSGSKNWNQFKGVVAEDEINNNDVESILFRDGQIVGDGLLSIGGLHTEYSLTPSLGASWSFWDFSISASYSISTFWTYDAIADDEFTSENTDDNGDRIVQGGGRQVAQLTRGSLALSYRPSDIDILEGWGASLSLRNSTPPKTADNRSFNFPFWTFDAATNRSAISLGISYSYGGDI